MAVPRIFVSYSHKDEEHLQQLLPYLATLNREGLVDVWTDKRIQEGDRWKDEIDAALSGATIAVLLISQNFMASDFIYKEELPRILTRQINGELVVLPAFLSPSTVVSDVIAFHDRAGALQHIRLSEFQGFGTPGKTLAELQPNERQRVFVALNIRIKELATGTTVIVSPEDHKNNPSPLPRVSQIPYARNQNFTGREKYLESLHTDLRSGKTAAVTQAVAGLGGIGKTQLALEYSYRYSSEYDLVWWIRAERTETCREDMVALGKALGIIAEGSELEDVVEATLSWLDSNQNWLLVFDNAEQPSQIRDFLPRARQGNIIITSRYAAWGAVAKPLMISLWTPEESVQFLFQRTGQDDRASAFAISEALGYLPLALSQVAAYLDEVGSDLRHYLDLINDHPAAALQLRPNSSDAEKAIATVWEISFEKLERTNREAVFLLSLFSFLAPDRISREMLTQHPDQLPPPLDHVVTDPLVLDNAVAALRSFSLITTTQGGFSVHRLVQAVVRSRMGDDDYRRFSEAAKELESAVSTTGDGGPPGGIEIRTRSLSADEQIDRHLLLNSTKDASGSLSPADEKHTQPEKIIPRRPWILRGAGLVLSIAMALIIVFQPPIRSLLIKMGFKDSVVPIKQDPKADTAAGGQTELKGLSVPELAKLYNFPTAYDGKGQTIGLIELGGGYKDADLSSYFSKLSMRKPQVTSISVDGGKNSPGINAGADSEVTANVEVAGAAAPGARIAVYFAPNTDQGFTDAISAAVHDTRNNPSVILISWGSTESDWTARDRLEMNQTLQAAATLGITVTTASGDNGSTNGLSDGKNHVLFPASSPYALAIGGTRISISNSVIVDEVAWNDGQPGGASGGGFSDFFLLPSWQANAHVPPRKDGTLGRGLPDVAINASPLTGYSVVIGGQEQIFGGTDLGAALWAGLIARINQALGKNVGYVNPIFWEKFGPAGVFHSITKGNNGAYSAGPGWNPVTGWGTPDGMKLLAAFQEQAPQR